MRQDNELTRLLEDRYKKVYDACMDEMISKEEMTKRTKEREGLYVGVDFGKEYRDVRDEYFKIKRNKLSYQEYIELAFS